MPASKADFRWAAKARAVVAFCLAGIAAGTGLYLGNAAFIRAAVPASSASSSCPGACVTDGSYAFDPGSAAVTTAERAIATEDARVKADGRHYVSVALLGPFTYTSGGGVSLQRMADELRGAYLAQRAINARGILGVQLILANEGTTAEELQGAVVRQLETLEGAPDHLVAITGMGISVIGTAEAADALAANAIAMFGAVTTADQFSGLEYPGFDQVTPDVKAQVAALSRVLGHPGPAILILDQDTTDLYTEDLQGDFMQAFGQQLQGNTYLYTPAFIAYDQFTVIAANACAQWGAAPPVVFYAGRVATLAELVTQFQQATDCAGKKVTIVTTSDADGLDPAVTRTSPTAAGAQVSVEYTDIANLGAVTPGFLSSYREYLGPLYPGPAGLPDPWTIASYNAMMAAGTAIDAAARASTSAIPTKADVRRLAGLLNGPDAPQGATGAFSLSPDGQLLSPDIPVYLDANGTRTTIRS